MNFDDIDIEKSWDNFKRIVGDREFHIRKYDEHRAEVFEIPKHGEMSHIVYHYKKFLIIWRDLNLIKEIEKGWHTYPCFKITD